MLPLFSIFVLLLAFAYGPLPRTLRRPRERRPELPLSDSAMIVDLACAAISSGASIPRCLEALDAALAEEADDRGLAAVAGQLLMGASWSEAWAGTAGRFAALRDALEPSWDSGAAPLALLERTAASIRTTRARAAREAAAQLAAKLVLPLGLCFLPAFVLVGVVPVVASTGMSIFG